MILNVVKADLVQVDNFNKYYDIGVNLFCKQFPNPEQIINDALQSGVTCILTGTDPKENRQIDTFINNHQAYGTVGIHPHNADSTKDKDYLEIENIAKTNNKIVAIGECGLDFDRMFSTKENQIKCFEKQIEIAETLNMPLFLHERNAVEDFIKVLSNHKEICKKSIVHCFTGNTETLKKYLSMGCYIGITGWICDSRRAKDLRQAVKYIPLDRIMIETDSPFLTPKNIQGLSKTNYPQNVKYVAKELAIHMGVPENTLISKAKENTEHFFSIHL